MAAVITTTNVSMVHGQGGQGQLAASGTTGALTWSAPNVSLPPGVNFTSDGKVTGTPLATGVWTTKITVDDSSTPPQHAETTLTVAVT